MTLPAGRCQALGERGPAQRGAESARPLDRPTTRASFLSWLYERLYHELAWAYDPVSWLVSGGRWRTWQRAVLPYLVGHAVLDVGCGPGHLLDDLAAAGYRAYGVDRSPEMARRASARAARAGRPGTVLRADARALPFGPGRFDSVVLTFPAPVVADPALWQEVARVLRPGGRAVVVLGATSNRRLWPGLVEQLWHALGRPGGRRPGRGAPEGAAPRRAPRELELPIPLTLAARQLTQTTFHGTAWLLVAEVVRPASAADQAS